MLLPSYLSFRRNPNVCLRFLRNDKLWDRYIGLLVFSVSNRKDLFESGYEVGGIRTASVLSRTFFRKHFWFESSCYLSFLRNPNACLQVFTWDSYGMTNCGIVVLDWLYFLYPIERISSKVGTKSETFAQHQCFQERLFLRNTSDFDLLAICHSVGIPTLVCRCLLEIPTEWQIVGLL